MGVAQKTTSSIDSSANSKRGVSGALLEYIRSGIGFITILPIFRHHFPGLLFKFGTILKKCTSEGLFCLVYVSFYYAHYIYISFYLSISVCLSVSLYLIVCATRKWFCYIMLLKNDKKAIRASSCYVHQLYTRFTDKYYNIILITQCKFKINL